MQVLHCFCCTLNICAFSFLSFLLCVFFARVADGMAAGHYHVCCLWIFAATLVCFSRSGDVNMLKVSWVISIIVVIDSMVDTIKMMSAISFIQVSIFRCFSPPLFA